MYGFSLNNIDRFVKGEVPFTREDDSFQTKVIFVFSYVLAVIFLNYDTTLGTFYTLILFGATLIWIMQGGLGVAKKLGGQVSSYGNPQYFYFYLIVALLIAIVFTLSAGTSSSYLAAAQSTIALAPFQVVVSLETLTNSLQRMFVTGLMVPIVEEISMIFFASVVAFWAFNTFREPTTAFVLAVLLTTAMFMTLHTASYWLTIEKNYAFYQSMLPLQAGHVCPSAYFYNANYDGCSPIPPQPGTQGAWDTYFGMLFWVGIFRLFMSTILILGNALWIGILAHALHNIFITAFFVIGSATGAIFALLGGVVLLLIYVLWFVSYEKEQTKLTSPSVSFG